MELAFAHRDGEREARHRETHAPHVDVTFVVEPCHDVTNVLSTNVDRTCELVEANGTAAHLRAGKVAKDVRRDRLERLVMKLHEVVPPERLKWIRV
jgi:hypothetical protein